MAPHEHPGFSRVQHLPTDLSIPECGSLISVITAAVSQHGGAASLLLSLHLPCFPHNPNATFSFTGTKGVKNNLKIYFVPLVSNDGRTVSATSIFGTREQIWERESSPVPGKAGAFPQQSPHGRRWPGGIMVHNIFITFRTVHSSSRTGEASGDFCFQS